MSFVTYILNGHQTASVMTLVSDYERFAHMNANNKYLFIIYLQIIHPHISCDALYSGISGSVQHNLCLCDYTSRQVSKPILIISLTMGFIAGICRIAGASCKEICSCLEIRVQQNERKFRRGQIVTVESGSYVSS